MLTDKKRAFVMAYVADPRRNARRAAEVANYGSARVMGPRLLQDPEVMAEIERIGGAQVSEVSKATASEGVKAEATLNGSEKQPTIASSRGRKLVGVCQLKGWVDEVNERHLHGRPTLYSSEIAEEICYRIATSAKSLKRICDEEEGFPNHRTVLRWAAENEEFCHLYARAREMQGDYLAFECLEIADDDSLDIGFKETKDGEVKQFIDHEAIARSRLKVDHRKWLASKLAPRKYGDKLEIAAGGTASGNPLADLIRELQQDATPLISVSKRFRVIEIPPEEINHDA